jgi:hypothetical protein
MTVSKYIKNTPKPLPLRLFLIQIISYTMTDKKLNTHAHLKSTSQWICSVCHHSSTHQTDTAINENRNQNRCQILHKKALIFTQFKIWVQNVAYIVGGWEVHTGFDGES